MDWRVLAVITPLLFVTYQTISKFIPKDAPLFLINAVASFIGAIVMFVLYKLTPGASSSINTKIFPLVVGIGLLISFGNFFIIKAYSLGAPQTQFTTIFYSLLILYGVGYGLLFWHEKLNMYQILGVVLSLFGVFLMVYFKK